MTKNEGLNWLEKELQDIGPYFNQSDLYKLLKKYLEPAGYWKGKPRGKPTISNLTPRIKDFAVNNKTVTETGVTYDYDNY